MQLLMNIVFVGDIFIRSSACIQELEKVATLYHAHYELTDWETHDLETLREKNLKIEKEGPASVDPPKELWELVKHAHILIVHFCPVSTHLIQAAPQLKVIATLRTGLSNIDTKAAREKGIEVVNLPGRLAGAVSELTIGLIFAVISGLLAESDILSIHTSLNETTKGMIGEQELALMKPTSYLINTARAEIIWKDALYKALLNHSIAGAALDVFWEEPIGPNDPFIHLDNVVLTPHLGGTLKDTLSKSMPKLNTRLQPYYERLSNYEK